MASSFPNSNRNNAAIESIIINFTGLFLLINNPILDDNIPHIASFNQIVHKKLQMNNVVFINIIIIIIKM